MLKCDNCNKQFLIEELKKQWPEIPHLVERLDPGGVVPHGECPDCGALVYEHKEAMMRVMRCRVCADLVPHIDMWEHLIKHNPNAEGMDCEEVRDQYDWVGTAAAQVSRLDVLTALEEMLLEDEDESVRTALRKRVMELE